MPTSTTAAPGLTKSRVTNAGRPIAATRMSASARDPRQIDGARMADRDGRVAVQQQQRHRLADDVAAADDDGARAGDRHVRSLEQFDHARRRARNEAARGSARAGRRSPGESRRRPSPDRSRRTPAARRRRPSRPAAATAPGCRRAPRCDSADRPRAAVRRATRSPAAAPDPRAVPVSAGRLQLAAHVDLRRRVVADEHDAEPRRPPGLAR